MSDQDISYIKAVHADNTLGWDERMSILMNRFDKSERTIRRWISKLGFSKYQEIENEEIRQGKLRKYDPERKYYIITWAQNATPVHLSFWKNILAYAEHLNANIGVVQGRYQNPTSLWTKNMEGDEWWDEPLKDYTDGARHDIHEYLSVLSDVKISPTAVNPLTGFEGISGDKSSIFGHPRVHLRSLPVPEGHAKKLLLTTGACTIKNYTDTKAGKKAEFHHTYGFAIVEIKDDYTFYVRQVTAKDEDGSFTDLCYNVKDQKVTEVDSCAVFVMGDLHNAQLDVDVFDQTMDLFNNHITPRRVVMHDVFDGQSVNHHEAKDPIKAFKRYETGQDIVSIEIDNLYKLIEDNNLLQFNPIVVRSNHDIWLDRWIVDKDWKSDVRNAKEYMEFSLALLNGEAEKGILPYLLERRYQDGITCLNLDEGYKILGWELGHHGHLGTHGSKGNINQFRKLNTKVIVGDYHQPARKDGALGVGTYSKLRMGYNTGPSAWMHAGVMVHNDGKAQHIIFMEDKKFTTFF